MKRIGGEFELTRRYSGRFPHGLPRSGLPYEAWLNSARNGVRLALDVVGKGPSSKRVWLPSYLCPEILPPFTERGYALHFYPVSADLQIRQFPSTQDGDLFLFIHYFGFPNTGALNWLSAPSQQKLWVVEDAVQSALPVTPHPRSDFVLASPRKFFPVSDGAMLGSRHAVPTPTRPTPLSVVAKKTIGKFFRGFEHAPDRLFLGLLQHAEADLAALPPMRMSSVATRRLRSEEFERAAAARRTNFSGLRDAISGVAALTPVFAELPDEVYPLGLPVRVAHGRRDELRAALKRENIFCAVHWPLEGVPRTPETEASHALSAEILTLPIDQRYTLADMRNIAEVLRRTVG
jgi:hypothetical protein